MSLAEGSEKIGADQIAHQDALERERIHVLLLEDANRGLADIAARRTEDADAAIARLQQRRKAAAETGEPRG